MRYRASVLLVIAALSAAVAGCGGDDESEGSEPVTGTFVGEASDFDGKPEEAPSVAVVVSDAEEDARDVRAYVCDGQRINEWFTGSASGNDLELTSESGARFDGRLTPNGASGEVTLPYGESFSFGAEPATGVGGFYEVVASGDGKVRGTSAGGGRIEGQLADGRNQDGSYTFDATITAAGETLDFKLNTDSLEPGEARVIALNDGRLKGAKVTTATGSGTGYTNPDQDL